MQLLSVCLNIFTSVKNNEIVSYTRAALNDFSLITVHFLRTSVETDPVVPGTVTGTLRDGIHTC